MNLEIRKMVSVVETTRREMGREVGGLRRKVATGVVCTNPYAGRYVEQLDDLVELGAELGRALIDEALAVLGCPVDEVSAYGKAAVVGTDGEIEHAAALIHPRFGAPIRAALGRGPAIIPSTKLLGGPGRASWRPSRTAPTSGCSTTWTPSPSASTTPRDPTRSSPCWPSASAAAPTTGSDNHHDHRT